MTNGEKLKEVFPNMRIDVFVSYVQAVGENYEFNNLYPLKWWNAEYKEPTTKNDLALIHTWGLDEGIRCAMCTNSIKSDRGCDGGCVVNNAMYKEVMDVIENHIVDTDKMVEPTTKNDLGVDCISREAVDRIINKWLSHSDYELKDHIYSMTEKIHNLPSVTPQEPRIITCKDCKYYRNKGNKRSYCTKRLNVDSVTDRYREPNFYCADAVLREVEE